MKINLSIDGNYLLFKNVFALKKTKTIYGDLKKALVENVRKYSVMFDYENKFFVSDSRKPSWRKLAYQDYKAKRKKDKEIDWDKVFEIYEEAKEELRQRGIHVVETDGAEGDDWMHLLIKKSNQIGVSVLTVSADRDIMQLLTYAVGEHPFMNLQIEDPYGKEQIFVKSGYQIAVPSLGYQSGTPMSLSELLSLNNVNSNHDALKALLDRWPIVEKDPQELLFKKIVEGDDGDNVVSIHRTPITKKDGSIGYRGIGKATAQQMWEIYQQFQMAESVVGTTNFSMNVGTPDFIYDVITILERVKKKQLTPTEREEVEANIKFNIRMVELNHKHIPGALLTQLAGQMKEYFN
jgi:5'-3' exonuclease